MILRRELNYFPEERVKLQVTCDLTVTSCKLKLTWRTNFIGSNNHKGGRRSGIHVEVDCGSCVYRGRGRYLESRGVAYIESA